MIKKLFKKLIKPKIEFERVYSSQKEDYASYAQNHVFDNNINRNISEDLLDDLDNFEANLKFSEYLDNKFSPGFSAHEDRKEGPNNKKNYKINLDEKIIDEFLNVSSSEYADKLNSYVKAVRPNTSYDNSGDRNMGNEQLKNTAVISAIANNQNAAKKKLSILDLLKNKSEKTVSYPLLFLVFIMLCYGLIILFSSSITNAYVFQSSITHYITRQLVFTSFGLIVMFFIARIDLRYLVSRKFILIILGISFLLLIAVLIPGIGKVIGGARRWIDLGFTTFQPSEFTKITLIFYLSWYYSRLRRKRLAELKKKQQNSKDLYFEQDEEDIIFNSSFSWQDAWNQAREEIIQPMLVVLASVFLIMLQAHVSASVIIVLVSLCIMASANLHWRSWALGVSLGVAALSVIVCLVIIVAAIFPNTNFTQRWLHVGRRITSFFNKEKSNPDDNRQTEQALIAIGSGKLTGLGLGQSRQKYLYLAENHNDYIFSIVCEELGFVGGVSIIFLFLIFLYLGTRIASSTSTMFAQLLSAGCTYLIAIQGFFSIGVNVNILPATGISLPLFSYGGTSNIFFLLAIGIILSISKHALLDETVQQ